MLKLFTTVVRICLFSAKPQDLDASREHLAAAVVVAIVVLFICYSALPGDRAAVVLSVTHAAVLGAAWMLLLKLHNKVPRWYQSATAVYGSSSLINLAQLPMILKLTEAVGSEVDRSLGSSAIAVTILWFWEIGVISSIIHQTLEIRRGMAVILAIVLSFAIQLVLIQLFGFK